MYHVVLAKSEAPPSDAVGFAQALAWPIAAIVLIVIVLLAIVRSKSVQKAFRRVSKVGVGSVAVEFTEEGSSELKGDVEGTFAEFRGAVRTEFDKLVYAYDLREMLRMTVTQHIAPKIHELGRAPVPDYRCTIHVEDVLVEDSLYQLLDYYPQGKGKGRAFSARRGIIGLAWRRNDPNRVGEFAPDVPDEASVLIERWGMTRQEAETAAQRQRRSFCAVVLRDPSNGQRVGLLYLDARKEQAFGQEEDSVQFLDAVFTGARQAGLDATIAELMGAVRKRGPAIRIYGGEGG